MDRNEILQMIERGRYLIPEYMWGGIQRYMVDRIAPGQFLSAVLSNDLMEAYARADDVNGAAMRSYVQFLYNYAPRGSYGSPAAVHDWLNPQPKQEAA